MSRYFFVTGILSIVIMSNRKSYSKKYGKNTILEFYDKKKNALDRRASWRKLFHKYSQPVLNERQKNIWTLIPQGCNSFDNNISKNKISTDIKLDNVKKVKNNINHHRKITETCLTRVIWNISSTGLLLVAVINVLSNKTINIKKHYIKDKNFLVRNTKLQKSKKYIQTKAFDSDSD